MSNTIKNDGTRKRRKSQLYMVLSNPLRLVQYDGTSNVLPIALSKRSAQALSNALATEEAYQKVHTKLLLSAGAALIILSSLIMSRI